MFLLMHRLITAATSLLVVAALIGCEKGVDSPKLLSQAQNQDSTVDPSVQLEQTPASSNTTENPSDDQAPALAVEPYEIEGIEVSLLKVQRASGKTLNVYWKMTNQKVRKAKRGRKRKIFGSAESYSYINTCHRV